MLLGCIADDFTGATDLANTLCRQGMSCVQYNGVPTDPPAISGPESEARAAVVALKSRSCPVSEAIKDSLAALQWLKDQGCRKYFFKYCSTFDSTDEGNIGPVAEALMDRIPCDFTVACPAAPENGRTVYKGHLFVGEKLLSDTGMRNHPLNPMTDSNLVNVLGRQMRGKVGLVPFARVEEGSASVNAALLALRQNGCAAAVVDALSEEHLGRIAEATEDLPLLTGGSGMAVGLPALFRRRGELPKAGAVIFPRVEGPAAVLSGSCSEATNRQVAHMSEKFPSYCLDPIALAEDPDSLLAAIDWAESYLGEKPFLIYSTTEPNALNEVQEQLGQERASQLLENAMAQIARSLVSKGLRRLVVAGGETSGAVVSALGIGKLLIGPEIDPGVPWTLSLNDPEILLALKSGNFGGPDFFMKAFEILP